MLFFVFVLKCESVDVLMMMMMVVLMIVDVIVVDVEFECEFECEYVKSVSGKCVCVFTSGDEKENVVAASTSLETNVVSVEKVVGR